MSCWSFHFPLPIDFRLPSGVDLCAFWLAERTFASVSDGPWFVVGDTLLLRADDARNFLSGFSLLSLITKSSIVVVDSNNCPAESAVAPEKYKLLSRRK
jgi:hypothetical protein